MKFLAKRIDPPAEPERDYPYPVSVKVVFSDRDGKEIAVYDPNVVLFAGQTITLNNIGLVISP